eukprot:evm.model.scf_1144EXC.1 EVM.evm.TU.scf_1144EXC.1   scf_1144EXC:10978-11377(-)
MDAPEDVDDLSEHSPDEDELFRSGQRFDWAEDVEEAIVTRSLDDDGCLSQTLLQNTAPKTPPLNLASGLAAARRGRRGARGSGRKGGHGEDGEKKGKGGKSAKGGRGDRRAPGGKAGQGEGTRPPLSGRSQSR